jgi:hypothetical protein
MHNEVIVDLPPEYYGRESIVDVKHEEDALCWLWAFPFLMPWHRPIAWLYTPVVGNAKWPGDLWGIDSRGDLIVTEAKRCKGHGNAFKDFVAFHHSGREELTADHWEGKWKVHLRAELAFQEGTSERPQGHTDGILPRSNRRQHIRRWPQLAGQIDRYIRSSEYSTIVARYLQARASVGNPSPYYFALMIESNEGHRILSSASIASAAELQRKVGHSHVVAVAISCRRQSQDKAHVSARKVELT